jgi:tRNA (adenine22-N1)-methyltransferase
MKTIALSKRLQAVNAMVTPGYTVCDVGCDHAHTMICLVQQDAIPRAIAMDINKGPLERARVHIAEHGLADKIEVRLSDGLTALSIGEAEILIIAGMGGPLMQAILSAYPAKTAAFREIILQPQSEIPAFRRYLRRNGFRTIAEEMVLENDKFYPLMKVIPGVPDPRETEQITIADYYGDLLLKERHPVLRMYIKYEQRITLNIINGINNSSYINNKSQVRLSEMERKAAELADLIGIW